MRVISQTLVSDILDYGNCIRIVRTAMADLSAGRSKHMLRHVIPAGGDNVLSVMAGAMAPEIGFGSKVITVYPQNSKLGRQSHQGVAILFDAQTGEPVCVIHAGELTRIRTAAASAVATDMLARKESARLAILGYGQQGQAHIETIRVVRPISSVKIWGRSKSQSRRVSDELSQRLNVAVEPAETVEEAVRKADIICTTTPAADPILLGKWIADGAHINLVGSSVAAFAEVDNDLVKRARYFADHRVGVLLQGGEYLRARAANIVDETHVLGEIGDVVNGALLGRIDAADVTVYKSLGHIVQDVACARYLHDVASKENLGTLVAF